MTETAFFRHEGGLFHPLEPARGYWSRDSLHGRALVGLLGRELELRHGMADMIPARFNVDMHRLTKFRPVEVVTRLIRDGRRLRLAEAVLLIDGTEYARAQCQFLRVSAPPPGRVWAPAPWDVPPPSAIAPKHDPERQRLSEWRVISGGLGALGPRRIWMREYHAVVDGCPLTPFSRVALSADFASVWTNSSDAGVQYMNTDIVVQLHRLPQGEWVGFEATGHDASQGIAVGNCRIYDEAGPIGYISATALTNQRS